MYTKEEAIKELLEHDHCFLSPEGVNSIGEPFGIKYNGQSTVNRPSEWKGLNCPGYKDGEKVPGIDAADLAEMICEKEKVEYQSYIGRGFRLRGACEAMLKHIKGGVE